MTKDSAVKNVAETEAWMREEYKRYLYLSRVEPDLFLRGIYTGKAETYNLVWKTLGNIQDWIAKIDMTIVTETDIILSCIDCDKEARIRRDPLDGAPYPACKHCHQKRIEDHDRQKVQVQSMD